jgi:hypothetical protein
MRVRSEAGLLAPSDNQISRHLRHHVVGCMPEVTALATCTRS